MAGEDHFEIELRGRFLRKARWHWRYQSANGEFVFSGQSAGYTSKAACENAVRVAQESSDKPIRYLTGH